MSNISYSGVVKLTFSGGRSVVSTNEGTSVLFSALCKLLTTARLSDLSILPSYISLIRDTNIDSTEYDNYKDDTLVITPLQINSRETLIEEGQPKCRFSSLITNSLLSSRFNSLNSNDSCYMMLLDGNLKIMAYAKYSVESLQALNSSNAQAVVEWQMTFTNKEKKN